MNKLKLDLDALQVDTFETTLLPALALRGTVMGQSGQYPSDTESDCTPGTEGSPSCGPDGATCDGCGSITGINTCEGPCWTTYEAPSCVADTCADGGCSGNDNCTVGCYTPVTC